MAQSIHMRTALAIVAGCLTVGGQTQAPPRAPNFLDQAWHGIQALQTWYNQATGLWTTTGWGNSAHAATVLVNYSRLSGSDEWKAAIENTFSVNAPKGFLNTY